jgi:hypothetical protein
LSRIIYVKKEDTITLQTMEELMKVNVPEGTWGEPYHDSHNAGQIAWDVLGDDGSIQFSASLQLNGVFSIWTQADNDAVNASSQAAQEVSNL